LAAGAVVLRAVSVVLAAAAVLGAVLAASAPAVFTHRVATPAGAGFERAACTALDFATAAGVATVVDTAALALRFAGLTLALAVC
jgi:hypothetical protein